MLTVMTWNVENFFTPDPAHQGAYAVKVAQLAAVISAAAPDLVAVQEVGDPASFDALRATLGAGWSGVLSTHYEAAHAIPGRVAVPAGVDRRAGGRGSSRGTIAGDHLWWATIFVPSQAASFNP